MSLNIAKESCTAMQTVCHDFFLQTDQQESHGLTN